MRSARFFRAVWRINGVIILAVACGALLLLAGAVVVWVVQSLYPYRSDMVNTDPASGATAHWRFGQFARVSGTHYLMAPVRSEQEWNRGTYVDSSYSKEANATRNYLFVDARDRSSHYLLPDNKRMILTLDQMHRADDEKQPVEWLWGRVVAADTNHDGRLTEDDGFSVGFAAPDGTGYRDVVPDVTDVLGATRRDRDILLLFYTCHGRSLVGEIDIPRRRLVTTRELPALPPS